MFLFKKVSKSSLKIIFSLFIIFTTTTNLSFAQVKSKEELAAELKVLEEQIAAHKVVIQEKQKEGASLSRDLTVLDSKIKKSELEIKLKDNTIKKLAFSISDKNNKITELSTKIELQNDSIERTFKELYAYNDTNLTSMLLNSNSISDYFNQTENFHKLQSSLDESVKIISGAKVETEKVKEELLDDKSEEEAAKILKESEKKNTQVLQKEKDQALKITKGQEKEYAKLLQEKEAAAAKVRSALFSLKDGTSIEFGTLYDYAKQAEKSTGVRTVFILAILSQETGLGQNTGQCYVSDRAGTLTSISTGAKRGEVHPTSVDYYFVLMDLLGREQNKTKVSCAYEGYGGAMGISQFMPATWKGYKSRIEKATGAAIADPWNAYHAITATAMYLQDSGAAGGSTAAEKDAACKYYSGRKCSATAAGARYGNSVLSKIGDIQAKIDVLQGV